MSALSEALILLLITARPIRPVKTPALKVKCRRSVSVQMPEEATGVGFHATTGVGAKCTEAHTHTLTRVEVLGVFRRDSVRCRRGSARRTLGGDHLSLHCVPVCMHSVNDGSVTEGAPCRTWDVYVALLMLGNIDLPCWVSRDADVPVSHSAGKACLSELASESEPRHQ